jgi:RNA polymerase-binding transcription factor DksA
MPRATKAGEPGKTTAKKQPARATAAATKAAKGAPAAPEADGAGAAAGFDAAFLEAQRAMLLEERESHTRQAAGLRAEAEQLAEERDPGDVQFDEESGQGDTMNVERERDLALSAQALQQVQEIDAALAKLDKGTYGLCERCGKPIPEERLQALPWAALDVGCKSMGFARR